MSLNDIQLNSQLVADLFPSSLIETYSASPDINPVLKQLGNNEKNILLIISNEALPFLSDQELSFLTSILSACRLSLADIALINIFNAEESIVKQSIQKLAPTTILLFGIEPPAIGLPINFPQFQLQHFDKRTYLYSPTFKELEKDKTLKSMLWTALKRLFELT